MRKAIVFSILILTITMFQARFDRAWGSSSPSDAVPAELSAQGKISVVDGKDKQPTAQLIREDGKAFLLIGPHQELLKELRFAVIQVWGTPDKPILNRKAISVSRFEIVSIDGEKPLFGKLMAKDGKAFLHLEDGTSLELSAKPNQTDTLLVGNGHFAWVIGQKAGNTVLVSKFKVL